MTDILIVEDNREIAVLLRDFLRAENYTVAIADNGEKALQMYKNYGAKLVVLDIMLPKLDGFEVCRQIRESENIPIIIVSAKGEKGDKLKGLALGADDYIEKPYDIDILLAKIKGVFKRRYPNDIITCGNLVLDRMKNTAYKADIPLQMTAKEFELLIFFIENSGRTLPKDLIFDKIWGSDSFSEQQTLTVHIKWLREKIEDNPKEPKHIITVWGVGYRFEM